jgi:hypothetical protein
MDFIQIPPGQLNSTFYERLSTCEIGFFVESTSDATSCSRGEALARFSAERRKPDRLEVGAQHGHIKDDRSSGVERHN